jgi:hypothetical protein
MRREKTSVGDPEPDLQDPNVFGPLGSGSVSISRRYGSGSSSGSFFLEKTRKTLYFAMIHSHIVYCMSIYSCANSTSLNKLRIKQKEAIRVICNAGYREHTAPLFNRLKILPVDQLINLCISCVLCTVLLIIFCHYHFIIYGQVTENVNLNVCFVMLTSYLSPVVPRAQKKKTNALQVPLPRRLSWPCVSDLH